jgi:hypothetical protein
MKEGLDPWRGEVSLLPLQLPDRVPWLIDLRATGYGLAHWASSWRFVWLSTWD